MTRRLAAILTLLPSLAFADGAHFFLPEPSPAAADTRNEQYCQSQGATMILDDLKQKPVAAFSIRPLVTNHPDKLWYEKDGTIWYTNQANPGVNDMDTGLTPEEFGNRVLKPWGAC